MYPLGQSIKGPSRFHHHHTSVSAARLRPGLTTLEAYMQRPSVWDGEKPGCQRVTIGELALLAEVAHSVRERTDTEASYRLVGQASTVGHGSSPLPY